MHCRRCFILKNFNYIFSCKFTLVVRLGKLQETQSKIIVRDLLFRNLIRALLNIFITGTTSYYKILLILYKNICDGNNVFSLKRISQKKIPTLGFSHTHWQPPSKVSRVSCLPGFKQQMYTGNHQTERNFPSAVSFDISRIFKE